MGLSLDRLARPFVVFSERFYPDPFVFAIVLTGLTLLLAIGLTGAGPVEAILVWGGGLKDLLAFTTQVCVTLVCAHALAHTDAVRAGIRRVAGWPRRADQAYVLVVLLAGAASLLAGALGLAVGALSAVAIAERGCERGLRLHYPLLVAGAYSGFLIWHMGYSGTVPLIVATPGHPLEATMGRVSVVETTYSLANLGLAVLTLGSVAWVCGRMAPPDEAVIELAVDGPARADLRELGAPEPLEGEAREDSTWAARIERARALSLALGALLAAYLAVWFAGHGFEPDYNVVNWTFLCAGLLLARSPLHYLELIVAASRTIGPVILMYPFYGGIMALMQRTELGVLFAAGFTQIATAQTLAFWAFVSGGLVNLFVPSGGGQWAVQGPIFIEAAKQLEVAPAVIVLGVAYGDQWTNLIQPFWSIPLLAIAGLNARAIMGYCFVVFCVAFLLLGGGLLLLGAG